ncbi:MAG: nitroreductase [Planctomycetota bacterium]
MTSRELLAYLGERRSPKLSSLADPAPDDAQLRAILGVASRTPDHGRLVPWRFITIAGDCRYRLSAFIGERFAESHADANDERLEVMRHCLSRAPLVVAVVFSPRSHPKIPHWEQMLTVGAVCMNLLHGARALGFAGLWLTEWYAYDRAVLDELGLAGDEQLAGFIHLGTSTEPRDDRLRPDLDDIVSAYSHGRTRSGGTG